MDSHLEMLANQRRALKNLIAAAEECNKAKISTGQVYHSTEFIEMISRYTRVLPDSIQLQGTGKCISPTRLEVTLVVTNIDNIDSEEISVRVRISRCKSIAPQQIITLEPLSSERLLFELDVPEEEQGRNLDIEVMALGSEDTYSRDFECEKYSEAV
jgi:hypothetical protein